MHCGSAQSGASVGVRGIAAGLAKIGHRRPPAPRASLFGGLSGWWNMMAMDECLRPGANGARTPVDAVADAVVDARFEAGCANQFPAGMTPKPLAYGESLPLQPSAPSSIGSRGAKA